MFFVPRLRHGAGSTASRFSRHNVFTSRKPDCCAPVARGLATFSLAARGLSQSFQPFTLYASPSRPSHTRQKSNNRKLLDNARHINIDAPREPTAGSEPGIDITDKDAWPQWRQTVQSQITAVDFSVDRIEKYELNNSTLSDFLAKPREDWVTCRWINGELLLVRTDLETDADTISFLYSQRTELGCRSITGREAETA